MKSQQNPHRAPLFDKAAANDLNSISIASPLQGRRDMVCGVGGVQPTAASATRAVGRIYLTVGAFFLAVFPATVAVMLWLAFSCLALKPREALAAYRG
jgi:hypothetical protein